MKLRNDILFNIDFTTSLLKLSKCLLADINITIDIARVIKGITEEKLVIFPIRDNIFKEYELIKWEKNTPILKDAGKVNDFLKKISSLLEQEFEIPIKEKIKVGNEMSKYLDASDLLALESILAY